jgi:hypothetical protein
MTIGSGDGAPHLRRSGGPGSTARDAPSRSSPAPRRPHEERQVEQEEESAVRPAPSHPESTGEPTFQASEHLSEVPGIYLSLPGVRPRRLSPLASSFPPTTACARGEMSTVTVGWRSRRAHCGRREGRPRLRVDVDVLVEAQVLRHQVVDLMPSSARTARACGAPSRCPRRTLRSGAR